MVLPHVRRHSGNGPTPRKKAFSLWSEAILESVAVMVHFHIRVFP